MTHYSRRLSTHIPRAGYTQFSCSRNRVLHADVVGASCWVRRSACGPAAMPGGGHPHTSGRAGRAVVRLAGCGAGRGARQGALRFAPSRPGRWPVVGPLFILVQSPGRPGVQHGVALRGASGGHPDTPPRPATPTAGLRRQSSAWPLSRWSLVTRRCHTPRPGGPGGRAGRRGHAGMERSVGRRPNAAPITVRPIRGRAGDVT